MSDIMTVLGPISTNNVGFCQFHEHIALSRGFSAKINPALCINDIQKSIQEVLLYKKAGGQTLIDAQPGGCNRDSLMLEEIAKQTKVNIIASTGFHKLIFYPEDHWIFHISKQELCRYFTEELTQGMYLNNNSTFSDTQTTRKAGIVKTALDKENLTPRYKKLFACAAESCIKTGTTMMIHVETDSNPLLLLSYLSSLGLPPSQMVFCHLDRAIPDITIHKAIADTGAYLEYDTIGRFNHHSNRHEIHLIKEMLQNPGKNFENQLLISLDTTADRLKSYTPGAIGLDYILTSFIEEMREHGIPEKQIEKMSRINAIHALTNEPRN